MKLPMYMKALCVASVLVVMSLLGAYSVPRGDAKPAAAAEKRKNDASAKVDLDFTQMNQTVSMTYFYRLAASPKEFEGSTIRISGTFLTQVDETDGKRYFGCLVGNPGGCSCCAPAGILEFEPAGACQWPTNFPPVDSTITVTGRLKIVETKLRTRSISTPLICDATIEAQ